ncbi:MAG: ABC transporter permease [Actinobacteria bacterium]|nr:MAG: ABC transporter permease [Actinomycetota bacterium]TML24861.1 MAG: ABC transporter permease [Actinomycetota bacterium]
MTRLRTIFAESLRSLGANMSTTLAAAVTVLIGMFLLGLFVALWSWAHSYDRQLKDQLAVRVYFCTSSTCPQEASAADENALAKRFNGDSRIKNIIPVSKEEALALMKKREPKAVEVLPANPFPDALKIYPKSGDLTPQIGKEIQDANLPGVQTVDWGGKLTKHVLHVTHVIETFFIAAAILLILASTLLIANTIRLSIFSRRREIEVMKLVGATNWFVRGPFMIEGLLCGLIGAIGAIVLLVIGKEVLLPSIGTLHTGSEPVKAISLSLNALVLVGVGLALGAAGSGLTIRRFLQV